LQADFDPPQFNLLVRFETTLVDGYRMIFHNHKREFEQRRLLIYKGGDVKILEPCSFVLINPLPREKPEIAICPDRPYLFVLEGVYDAPLLEFPGASYELFPGEAYRMKVRVRGVYSNEIAVTFRDNS
jgi:hypothetical protein